MKSTMTTMMLTGIRQMAPMEQPIPSPGAGEVLLKIRAVGVCGSDLHYYTTGRIGTMVVEFPFPVGHECSAEIAALGDGVAEFKEGDLVAVDPATPCHHCDQCRAGREHTCRNLFFLGCPGQIPGCMSEYYVMPAECCFKLRPDMDEGVGTLVEPLSIGCYAVKLAELPEKAHIGILGAGPIGLCVQAAARDLGAEAIHFTEPLEYRREMALRLGANQAVDPYAPAGIQPIIDAEPLLLDAVFECAGQQDALTNGVDLLKPGGKLVMIGIPEVDEICFTIDKLRRKELRLQNVRRQNKCVQTAIDLLEKGTSKLEGIITHHFPFAESKAAFDLLDKRDDGVMKIILHF